MAATLKPVDVAFSKHFAVPRQTFWDIQMTMPTERQAGGRCRSLSDGVLAELSSCCSDLCSKIGAGDTASTVDGDTVEAHSCCDISDCESDADSSCSRAETPLWSESSDDDSAKEMFLRKAPMAFVAPAVCVVPAMQTMVWSTPHCEGPPYELQAQHKPGKRRQAGIGSSTAGSCLRTGATQDCRTTLIFKNMCVHVMRQEFTEMLERHGFEGLFDFVYVRTNFKAMTSFGYGFANFVNHRTAERARRFFNGKASSLSHPEAAEGGVLEVSWTVEHQGLQRHLEHFRNSPMMHPDVPDKFKPLVLRNGVPVPMPPPRRRLSAPKDLRRALSSTEQSASENL